MLFFIALRSITVVFVSFVVISLIREFLWLAWYKRTCVQHGCAPPLIITDRPFGLFSFFRLLRAAREYRIIQTVNMAFEASGRLTIMAQTIFRFNILTIHPENIKAILATDFKSFDIGLRHAQLSPLLGNGIFTSDGPIWRHSRTMLRPQFSRERISRIRLLEGHVNELLAQFEKSSNTSGMFDPSRAVDAQLLFHRLTLDSASEFLFGISVDTLKEDDPLHPRMLPTSHGLCPATEIVTAMESCLSVLSKRARAGPLYWLFNGPKFRKDIALCHDFVNSLIDNVIFQTPEEAKCQEKAKENDINRPELTFIQEIALQTSDRDFIRDQAFTILLAGRDTTSALLSFTFYHLVRNKRVWSKLRSIVLDSFGPTSGDHITFDSLKRCKYLTNILNESLRLNPVVPMNYRRASRDTTIPRGGGPNEDLPVFVPKGTMVVYNVYLMHRLKEYWGENADKFYPERWDDPSRFHSWDYLPFNGGPRICLGQQFALTEAAYTLLRIAQTFKDIHTDPNLLNKELLQRTNLTTIVAGGVPMCFEK